MNRHGRACYRYPVPPAIQSNTQPHYTDSLTFFPPLFRPLQGKSSLFKFHPPVVAISPPPSNSLKARVLGVTGLFIPPIVPGVGGIWTISHSLAGVIGVFILLVVCTESISSSVFPGSGPKMMAWRAMMTWTENKALFVIGLVRGLERES